MITNTYNHSIEITFSVYCGCGIRLSDSSSTLTAISMASSIFHRCSEEGKTYFTETKRRRYTERAS